MFCCQFSLTNPRSRRWRNLGSRTGPIWGRKYWQVQIMATADIIAAKIEWTRYCDHAGLSLELGLLGYSVCAQIYDSRHWDYQKQAWE